MVIVSPSAGTAVSWRLAFSGVGGAPPLAVNEVLMAAFDDAALSTAKPRVERLPVSRTVSAAALVTLRPDTPSRLGGLDSDPSKNSWAAAVAASGFRTAVAFSRIAV